jgi:hypothetical protein
MKSIRARPHPLSFYAVALILGALSPSAGAQSPSSSAPQDRLLQPASFGSSGVEIVLPSQIADERTAWRISMMGRVVLGFEGEYDAPAQPLRRTLVDMAGGTVQQALDALVRTDPRYLWQLTNDVIVVRPVLASADPDNLLNQPVRDIDWQDVTVEQAFVNVRKLIHGSSNVPPAFPGSYDARLVSVRVRSGSVLDVLNEIVRAHGELMWSVVYVGPERRGVIRTGPVISLRWFDGHGIGGYPLRPQVTQDPAGKGRP